MAQPTTSSIAHLLRKSSKAPPPLPLADLLAGSPSSHRTAVLPGHQRSSPRIGGGASHFEPFATHSALRPWAAMLNENAKKYCQTKQTPLKLLTDPEIAKSLPHLAIPSSPSDAALAGTVLSTEAQTTLNEERTWLAFTRRSPRPCVDSMLASTASGFYTRQQLAASKMGSARKLSSPGSTRGGVGGGKVVLSAEEVARSSLGFLGSPLLCTKNRHVVLTARSSQRELATQLDSQQDLQEPDSMSQATSTTNEQCLELRALVKKYTTHNGQRVNMSLLRKNLGTKRYDRVIKNLTRKLEAPLLRSASGSARASAQPKSLNMRKKKTEDNVGRLVGKIQDIFTSSPHRRDKSSMLSTRAVTLQRHHQHQHPSPPRKKKSSMPLGPAPCILSKEASLGGASPVRMKQLLERIKRAHAGLFIPRSRIIDKREGCGGGASEGGGTAERYSPKAKQQESSPGVVVGLEDNSAPAVVDLSLVDSLMASASLNKRFALAETAAGKRLGLREEVAQIQKLVVGTGVSGAGGRKAKSQFQEKQRSQRFRSLGDEIESARDELTSRKNRMRKEVETMRAENKAPKTQNVLLSAIKQDFQKQAFEALARRYPDKIDKGDVMGLTPLHWAALRNKPDLVRVLLKLGADCEQRDARDRTPYELASARKSTEAAKLLDLRGSTMNLLEFL